MKQLLICTLFAVSSSLTFAAGRGNLTINVDNVDRKAVIFSPVSSTEGPLPLLLFLHPNGYDIDKSVSHFNLDKVADQFNAFVVVPEALDEQNTEVNELMGLAASFGMDMPGFALNNVWNAGAQVSVDVLKEMVPPFVAPMLPAFLESYPDINATGLIRFNKDVDDVKFLNALLTSIKSEYRIDANRVFVMGGSMGGAMTYRYILSPNSQAKGAVVFCGFLGGGVEFGAGTKLNIPLMVVHSKTDDIVAFDGGMLDIAVPERIKAFAGATPATTTSVKDLAADGISVVRYDYNAGQSNHLRFFELDGALHTDFLKSDYASGPNDIDYITEAHRFLFAQGEESAVRSLQLLSFAYNSATDHITLAAQGSYTITALSGATVQTGVANGSPISVANLSKGIYIFTLQNTNGTFTAKLVK